MLPSMTSGDRCRQVAAKPPHRRGCSDGEVVGYEHLAARRGSRDRPPHARDQSGTLRRGSSSCCRRRSQSRLPRVRAGLLGGSSSRRGSSPGRRSRLFSRRSPSRSPLPSSFLGKRRLSEFLNGPFHVALAPVSMRIGDLNRASSDGRPRGRRSRPAALGEGSGGGSPRRRSDRRSRRDGARTANRSRRASSRCPRRRRPETRRSRRPRVQKSRWRTATRSSASPSTGLIETRPMLRSRSWSAMNARCLDSRPRASKSSARRQIRPRDGSRPLLAQRCEFASPECPRHGFVASPEDVLGAVHARRALAQALSVASARM